MPIPQGFEPVSKTKIPAGFQPVDEAIHIPNNGDVTPDSEPTPPPDLTQEQGPVGKGVNAFLQNVNPFPGIKQAFDNPDSINPVSRLVHGDTSALVPILGGPGADIPYGLGKQVVGDIGNKAPAEAIGHILGTVVPLLLGRGAAEVNPEAVTSFGKGAMGQITKTPVPWKGALMAHYLGMPPEAGVGTELAARLPNIYKAGVEAKGDIPWRRPNIISPDVSQLIPEEGYHSQIPSLSEELRSSPIWPPVKPVERPLNPTFSPEQIAEYQKGLPPVRSINTPPRPSGIADIDVASAQPKVVRIKHEATPEATPKEETTPKEGGMAEGPKGESEEHYLTKLRSSGASEREINTIRKRRINEVNKADLIHHYILDKEDISPSDLQKMVDTGDVDKWKDIQAKAHRYYRERSIKITPTMWNSDLKSAALENLLRDMKAGKKPPSPPEPSKESALGSTLEH